MKQELASKIDWPCCRSHRARIALTGCLAILLSSCASQPDANEFAEEPSPHRMPGAPTGIVDERARFRDYFCAELSHRTAIDGAAANCNDWLHRLPDEVESAYPANAARKRLQALFVTGAFSECFGDSARPFGSAIDAMAGSGDEFGTVVVDGRSGTAHNAAEIADFLADWPADPDKPIVLFGYSKGTSDILQFLVDYPELAAGVSAVVSVAGSVGGSPLADHYGSLYDLLFSHLPFSQCEHGDGDVVDSLRTEVRGRWLRENTLPEHIRYYSLVAFTTRERMARALVPSWELLLDDSRRNDGQLLPIHALLPQSTLLAYLDADHWAVAMELEKEHGFLADRPDPAPFPRRELLSAMLRTVGEDLAATERQDDEVSAGAPRHRSGPDPLRR